MVPVSLSHRKTNGVTDGRGDSLMRNALPKPMQSLSSSVCLTSTQTPPPLTAAKPPTHLNWISGGETYFPWEIRAQQFSTLTAGPPCLCFSTESGETVMETVHASIRC